MYEVIRCFTINQTFKSFLLLTNKKIYLIGPCWSYFGRSWRRKSVIFSMEFSTVYYRKMTFSFKFSSLFTVVRHKQVQTAIFTNFGIIYGPNWRMSKIRLWRTLKVLIFTQFRAEASKCAKFNTEILCSVKERKN